MKVSTFLPKSIFIGIALNLIFIVFFLATNPLLFQYAGSSIIISCVLLVLYALIYGYFAKAKSQNLKIVGQVGVTFGLATGVLHIFILTFENFVDLPQPAAGLVTLFFMFTIFFTFAISGFKTTNITKSIKLGIASALVCAMVGVVFALLTGFLMNLLFAGHLEHILLTSGEYQRSNIHSIKLFTVFNTFDSATSQLIEVPVIALFFGFIGGGISKLFSSKS